MATERTGNPRSHREYTIGWICALAKEQTAAAAMLDVRHGPLPKAANDTNSYILGSISGHNIVIACLPMGETGTNAAATVVARMLSTFPSIRFGLLVGIGSGIPKHDVRLGDVVVSVPTDHFPGVVQWDMGKALQHQGATTFKRTGSLNRPPVALLTALNQLVTEHDLEGSRIPEFFKELETTNPKFASKYLRSGSLKDVLFAPDCAHNETGRADGCNGCDTSKIITRKLRPMEIHYGLIASGNQLIKSAMVRDRLDNDLGGRVLCLELHAAGLMNSFPCLVIRGICDYADSHDNKIWEEYAAAVAAAYAKELLEVVQPADVRRERAARDLPELKNTLSKVCEILDTIARTVNAIWATVDSSQKQNEKSRVLDWLTDIQFGPHHSLSRDERQPGTGTWFLNSTKYYTWRDGDVKVLFCEGIPAAGKPILPSMVIEHLANVSHSQTGETYVYCDYRHQDEQTAIRLISSLIKEACFSRGSLLPAVKALQEKCARPLYDPSLFHYEQQTKKELVYTI
ncbi:nucleoside phosphorylase domain-containing protein [Pseudoneurospora amorphoporcata]|uniref:Nucleoside phosphorylase domain-containing protein n=1 Tax=Pseudoneurospora amorphoporcata TaxID=241081 RepID=A0AAN6P1U3_9PEZI|nr:nucleoside phosphorylase domain-containing protein [Pseudoneurospora amorphoporcata]